MKTDESLLPPPRGERQRLDRVRLARGVLSWTLIAAISVAGLFLVEGGVSFFLFGKDLLAPPFEPTFTTNLRRDSDLGWTHIPGFRSPDFYGAGAGLSVDERGARCSSDACEDVAGGTRVICSGDSFTLGYGVGDQDTWCHLLSVDLSDVATINLGQGGYGLDQMYLRYMRDGLAMKHDVLLFAFIEDDFRRLRLWRFSGRPKPVLRVRNGQIVTLNVPVPAAAGQLSLSERLSGPVEQLGIVRLARRLDADGAPNQRASESIRETSTHIFLRLMKETSERGITAVFVYLPTIPNHTRRNDNFFVWRDHARSIVDSAGGTFIDLSPELRRLSSAEMRRMFIQTGDTDFPGAEGHYSPEGHRWVADQLMRHLTEIAGMAPS